LQYIYGNNGKELFTLQKGRSMFYKKFLLAISFLLSNNLNAPSVFEHHVQTEVPTTHIATSATGVSASSELITVLQDIASSLSSSTNVKALSTILQQLNAGINVFDIQILEQALQEALGVLASSGGVINPFTVIEYTGILVGAIAQLEAAHAQAVSAATSTIVTATTH